MDEEKLYELIGSVRLEVLATDETDAVRTAIRILDGIGFDSDAYVVND